MGNKGEIKERIDIDQAFKWDIESMYPNFEKWEEDFKKAKEMASKIGSHKGKVIESSQSLLETLNDEMDLYKIIQNLYVYTHLNLDVDTRDGNAQSYSDKAMGLYVEINSLTSYIVPEILEIKEEVLEKYYEENKDLNLYRHHLGEILRKKDHILSAKEEAILAQMGEVASAPEKVFAMLNNADLTFPTIKGEDDKDVELSQANYISLMNSKNRQVRKDAFNALYTRYGEFKNTFAATLSGDLKKNIFNSRVRNYSSSRQASLDENNISTKVYDNLISSVHKNLDSMYKYMEIRKRALGLDDLHMYDLYTPIVKDTDMKFTYQEGVDLIKKALKPMGKEYNDAMEEAFSSNWVDIYPNRGKRAGAYSSGSYESKPFILLNFQDNLDNVFTTAHEMGHSMHSYFTRKFQPFVYGSYSIFVAEVASTANESLLMTYLLENTEDKNEKLYLLNHYLESFRTTVFRQTMFAEFEKIINEHLESGGALTADYLKEEYKKINELYYGPNVVIDEEIAMEWARIPHFYYNYYVYQYATGFSAAVDLSQKILKEGDSAVEKYLNFLKAGSSDYPINVLKKAGVDMTTEDPVNNALALFRDLVDEMDKLID